MEKFIVSARKYRPVTFDTVVGQPGITQTLKNAIRNNHLAQAFLFTGPRGVGKTTTARILAKTINCENITEKVEACNQCMSCKLFNEGSALSIYELDAASNNSVEDIRALVEQVRYPPQTGKYKIYIIDEVHMLSSSAFNAFLKTLEEPPSYAIFILATTEKHKIIPTILSRCQIFDFSRISVENIVKHLQQIAEKEGVDAEEDALHVIAQKADGALRDSLSLFDQLVSFAGNKLTYKDVIENLNILDYEYYFRITDDLLANNFSGILLTFNEILNKGFDPHNFINGLASHFRDLLVCKDEVTLSLLEVSPNIREKYKVQSRFCDSAWLLNQLDIAGKADLNFKSAKNQRLHIELTLLKMCGNANQLIDQSKKKVERSINSVVTPVPQAQTQTPTQTQTPAQPQTQTQTEITSPVKEKPVYTSPGKKTISISGKNNTEAEKKTEVVTEEVLPDISKPFDQKTLDKFWTKYADQLQKEGRMTLHTTFLKQMPVIEDEFQLSIVVESASIERDINEIKTDLLSFLRSSLSNYKINLKVSVEIKTEENDHPYTPSEKFKKLAEKNPKINDLKKKLDLEIDY
jgi:DNA polymerase-3 subunit gamma/tau